MEDYSGTPAAARAAFELGISTVTLPNSMRPSKPSSRLDSVTTSLVH